MTTPQSSSSFSSAGSGIPTMNSKRKLSKPRKIATASPQICVTSTTEATATTVSENDEEQIHLLHLPTEEEQEEQQEQDFHDAIETQSATHTTASETKTPPSQPGEPASAVATALASDEKSSATSTLASSTRRTRKSQIPPPSIQRISVIGSPKDFTHKQHPHSQSTQTQRKSAQKYQHVSSSLSNRSVASTPGRRMAYGDPTPSVNSHGTSVFERLYQDAQIRSNRKERMLHAQHERDYYNHPTNQLQQQQQYQTPQRTKSTPRRHHLSHPLSDEPPFLPDDNVSTMSSLCSPSAAASVRTNDSQSPQSRRSYKHTIPQQQSYYHRSGWSCNFATSTRSSSQSVTSSQDRRRFFQQDSSASVDGSRSYSSRFEKLYHNDYESSASRHKHETPKNLSPSVALARRNQYHPDRHTSSASMPSTRSVASTSKIPTSATRRTKLHSYPHRSYTPQPTRTRRNVNAISNSTDHDPSVSSSSSVPRPPSAAKELAKWKQLQKEWFLDHISDDSEEERQQRVQSRNGLIASTNGIHDDSSVDSSSSGNSSRASQVERALLQNATPPHEQMDSTRELHWEELQRGWNHFATSRTKTPLAQTRPPETQNYSSSAVRVVSQSSQQPCSNIVVDAEELFQSFEKMRRRRESFLSMKRTAGRLRALWKEQRKSLPSSSPLDTKNQERRVDQVMEERAASAIQSCWTRRYVHNHVSVDTYGDIVEVATPITPTESGHVLNRKEASAHLQETIGSLIQQAKAKSRDEQKPPELDSAASVCVQSCWRMARARMRYLGQQQAILLIQARFRSHYYQHAYWKSVAASILLQSNWRRVLEERKFQQSRCAAVVLQKTARGMIVREAIRQELGRVHAATLIQAQWRGYYIHEFVYWRQQVSIVRIQSWWRMVSSMTQRSFLSNQKTRNNCAVVIQSHYRACVASRHFRAQRAAAGLLQTKWRQLYCQALFQKQRKSILVLQNGWRCAYASALFRQTRISALCIQSLFRMQQSRKDFLAQKDAAKRIQLFWRSHVLQERLAREEHERVEKGLVLLQSLTRGYLSRNAIVRQFMAATYIQSIWRRHLHMTIFGLQRSVAISLQSMARSCMEQKRYRRSRAAATKIQSLARGACARHLLSISKTSALLIQNNFRGSIARSRWHVQRGAIVILQGFWRGIACREQVYRNICAAIKVQSICRGFSARKTFREYKMVTQEIRKNAAEKREIEQRSAIRLQTLARQKQARRRFVLLRTLVVRLQSLVRGSVARSKTRSLLASLCDAVLEMENQAASRIQSLWKANSAQAQFAKARSAAITLQSSVRMNQAINLAHQLKVDALREAEENATAAKIRAAIKLQSIMRFVAARSLAERCRTELRRAIGLKHSSARRVQSTIRMYKDHRRFKEVRSATVLLQSFVRMLNSKACLEEARLERDAARLQKEQAGSDRVAAIHLSPENHAAAKVQSLFRKFVDRRAFLEKKDAAMRIRKCYILWKAKALLLKFQCGSVLLRRGVEGRLPKCTSFALSQVNSCLRSNFSTSLASDVALQIGYIWGVASSEARSCAAVVVQRYARGFTRRVSYNKMKFSAQTAQRAYRGFVSRREFSVVPEARPDVQQEKGEVHFAKGVDVLEDSQCADDSSHQSGNVQLQADEVSSSDNDSMTSAERKVFAQGVETLQTFFDEANDSESERVDATNWFLSRMEMRSETEANLLLSQHSSNRACIDRLAERARVARAEIGSGHAEPVLGVENFLSPIKHA